MSKKPLFAGAAIVGATLALAYETLTQFGAHFTDEDQALFWLAAREIGRGRFHEPCFYGQAYNTLWEAFVAALPVRSGADPAWVVPLIALTAGIAPYFLLGVVAWKRSPFWGLVVSAAPLVLPAHFWMLNSLASYNGGVLFTTVGILVLDRSDARTARSAGFGLLTIALWINPNALPLALPAAAIAIRRLRRRSLWGIPGVAAAAAVVVASRAFYARHPSYALHVMKATGGSLQVLIDGLQRLDAFWTANSPETPFGPWGAVLVVVISAAAVWRRAGFDAMALLSGVLVGIGALASEKVQDGFAGIYLDHARMFLALPALAAYAVAWAARCDAWGDPAAYGWLAFVACATLGKLATLPPEIDRLALRSGPVTPVLVSDLRNRCDELAALARHVGADTLVFQPVQLRALDYGCAARFDGTPATIHPLYERRTWLFLDKMRSPTRRTLVVGGDGSFCPKVRGLCARCGPAASSQSEILVDCGETPLVDVLKRGELALRPF